MATVSSAAAVAGAIRGAAEVRVFSYVLRDVEMIDALKDAARRGASVRVRLEGSPFGRSAGCVARENARLVAELRACGADAALQPGIHAKAIEAGGDLYLDGRNWNACDLVVRADAGDDVAITKRAALEAEASLLREGGDAIVETENFGSGNAVYAALDALAKAGKAPRLLVNARYVRENARERALLERLSREGVRVRVTTDAEKCAIGGGGAWLGSANASWDGSGKGEIADWGLRTIDAGVVEAARARLERDWSRSSALR